MITYRWLESSELHLIDSIIEARGWMKLNEVLSRVLVAEENGKITDFIVFQAVPQVGPIYVSPEHRGTGVSSELANRMLDFLSEAQCRGFLVIADNPHSAKLCEERQMRKLESPVYVMQPEKVTIQ